MTAEHQASCALSGKNSRGIDIKEVFENGQEKKDLRDDK